MRKNRKFFAILLAVGMTVSAITGCGSSNDASSADVKTLYEPLIDNLCDSKENADLEEFLGLFGSMKSLMESVVTQDILDQTLAGYKESCGENIQLSYEITAEESATSDEIKNYQSNIEMFGETGIIQRAYDLTVQVNVKGDSGSSEYAMTLSVGEVMPQGGGNSSWIIVNFDDTLLK